MTDNTKYEVTQINQRGHFRGTNEQLCNSIAALLDLNDDGAVSHAVPGMAVTLLEAARHRLTSQPAPSDLVESLACGMFEAECLQVRDNEPALEPERRAVRFVLTHPTTNTPPTYKTMAELKAQRGDPAADLHERFPELRQWQQDRSEWHDETILEIVSEFIEWQRAAPTTDTQSDAVREKLKSAVEDFRWRARQCRTNRDAFDTKAASVWDAAADALETKHAV